MKAILSTTLISVPGTYRVDELSWVPDVSGVNHYVGHPDTRRLLDAAGAVYVPGFFNGLEPGECFLAARLKAPERKGEAGSVPNQAATAADLQFLRVTRLY